MSDKKVLFTYNDGEIGFEVDILDCIKKEGIYRVILCADPARGPQNYKYLAAKTFKQAMVDAQTLANIMYDHPEMWGEWAKKTNDADRDV